MNILFIQTGGTIDKDYPKANAGYAFEIDEPAVVRVLGKCFPAFEYEIMSLFRKDSMNITDDDRAKLKSHLSASAYSKIIVTHGSDTLVETAQMIGSIKDKTILFTGAYRPQRFAESDADFNIGAAVGALNVLTEGTFIVMNGKVMKPNECYKHPVTGLFETK